MPVRLFLLLLVGAVILIAVMVIRMLTPRKQYTPDAKLLKSFFLDHGEVSWLVKYKVNEDNKESIEIETLPFCKKCKAQYEYASRESEELRSLKCPSCDNIKRGYPLSTNYHSVQTFAEVKLKEFRKGLLR